MSRLRACPASWLLLLLALATGGCEKAMQDMYRQPRYDPFEPTDLFPNGGSARLPVPGTLALRGGDLAEATGGRRGDALPIPESLLPVIPLLGVDNSGNKPLEIAQALPQQIPFEVTAEVYRRGRERYDIYCTPCHSAVGDGDGMVVRRGFPSPPDYHSARLREAPDRHFYNVISQGYGLMYAYADRLSPRDRWAVVAYIRALQFSQYAPLSLLSEEERARLEAEEGGHD